MPKKIFIGAAWPYVNGDLHPGHIAGNFLPADIFFRFQKCINNTVLMVSGSDCYGTPTTVEADKMGVLPEEIVAKYHPSHLKLIETYGISFDLYTRTTTKNHERVVQELFLNLAKNGYLFKDRVQQYYSSQDNKFLPDRYVEGQCSYCGFGQARGDQCDNCGRVLDSSELKNPISKLTKSKVVLKDTEHLFFNLTKLQDFLTNYVKSHSFDWKPWVYKEVSGWLKRGLRPRAVTRDLTWGVKIPNEKLPRELQIDNVENKRIYVWFEAVIGYLSAAIEWAGGDDKKWREFWYPNNKNDVKIYNFMGKDNVVFHALFWPAQLWGAYGKEIKLPDVIAANQYLNVEGKKFSKSRGVTIDSVYLAESYGVDPVRFYLTYIMPEEADANFSWSDFVDVVNNVLIGSLGNFINRVLVLAKKYGFSTRADSFESKTTSIIQQIYEKTKENLSRLQFKLYAYNLVELAKFGNKYIDKEQPWNKSLPDEKRKDVLTNCLLIVLALQALIKPLLPNTSIKIAKMLDVDVDKWPERFLSDVLRKFLPNIKIQEISSLFTKIDPAIIEAEKAKLNLS